MNKIHFQLVTPEKTVLSDELDSLSCPTTLGQITVLPNHAPLVANLQSGELIARKANQEEYINVTGGFVEIRPNNEVIVLADAAEHHYEIDAQRAEEARKRAEQTLKEKRLSGEEYAKVAASLERNLARLRIARKRGRQKGAPITGEGVFRE
jgi:F-type H+-transporting ATPase subunit epsilon